MVMARGSEMGQGPSSKHLPLSPHPSNVRRRPFIASTLAGIGAISGCIASDPASPAGESPTNELPTTTASTPTATAEPTASAEPTPAADVAVQSLQLQYGLVTPNSPDSIGLFKPDTPYLVASVRVDGPLEYDGFGLTMGDVRYSPTKPERLYRTSWGDDHWYDRGRGTGLLLFEAPTKPTDNLRLTWPGGHEPVDDAILERLDGNPPEFTATIDVPAAHSGTAAPPVAIEVSNEGEKPGRFLGALNRTGPLVAYAPIARLSELVPGGEASTIAVSDSWGGMPGEERLGDGDPDVTYRLDHIGGEDSATIRLVEPS